MSRLAQSLELKEKVILTWMFSKERPGISSLLLDLSGVPYEDANTMEGGG